MSAYTLTILNEKGGVGKTTTAANLAGALAQRGWQILLVEFDSQAQASQWLGIPKIEEGDGYGALLRDAVLDKQSLSSLVQPTAFGVDVIPCGFGFKNYERSVARGSSGENLIRKALKSVQEGSWDLIIIDTKGGLDSPCIGSLIASQGVLIPIEARWMSLDPSADVVDVLDNVRDEYELKDLELVGVLGTKYEAHTKDGEGTIATLKKAFKKDLFTTIVHKNTTLGDAYKARKPITVFAPRSAGARDYNAVTDELIERIGLHQSEAMNG